MVEQPSPPPQPSPSGQHIEQTVLLQQSKTSTNVVGVIGFVLALLGLLFGWCFWPVAALSALGVILSFIGMFSEPRGLAIAGFIIGLLGCAVLAILLLVVGVLGAGLAGAAAAMPRIEGTTDATLIQTAVTEYKETNGVFPATLDDMTALDESFKTDFWGNPYRFAIEEVDGIFTLTSDGEDGVRGTEDDLVLHP